jgi:antitoxin component YwqK of YwqJK toxin-antitoxin module
MSKTKNISPRNNKGQRHGLWERYWDDGDLMLKGFYNNGKRVGYSEWYHYWNTNKLANKIYNL